MTSPWLGSRMEAAIFTKVVFPAPFGPMSAWIWPGSTVSETSLTAVNFPLSYVRETLRNSRAGTFESFESVEMISPIVFSMRWVQKLVDLVTGGTSALLPSLPSAVVGACGAGYLVAPASKARGFGAAPH